MHRHMLCAQIHAHPVYIHELVARVYPPTRGRTSKYCTHSHTHKHTHTTHTHTRMYVCMCIRMYLCMYVCMYECMYTYIQTYMQEGCLSQTATLHSRKGGHLHLPPCSRMCSAGHRAVGFSWRRSSTHARVHARRVLVCVCVCVCVLARAKSTYADEKKLICFDYLKIK